jgi:hypothetical protein
MPRSARKPPQEAERKTRAPIKAQWTRFNAPYREAKDAYTKTKTLTKESLKEIGQNAMNRLYDDKIIDDQLRKFWPEFYGTRLEEVKTLEGLDENFGHTIAFIVWLHDEVAKKEGRERRLAANDFGGPPTGGRPNATGIVDRNTAVRFYSDLVGREMPVSNKDVNVAITFWVRALTATQMSPDNYDGTTRFDTTSKPPKKSKGKPLRLDELDTFFNRLLFGVKGITMLFARYLLETGLRPDHAFWSLRLIDLERAHSDVMQDCTGVDAHLIRIKPAILEATAHEEVPGEMRIKKYPEAVRISKDLFNDLFTFVQGNLNSVRIWDPEKQKFDESWKPVTWDPATRTFTGLTTDEKEHSWVFMNLVPKGEKVAGGHNRLMGLISQRKERAAKFGLPEDPEGKFVVYSLRKTWATVVYIVTQYNIKALEDLANWTELSTILTYIETFPPGEAWLIKKKYGIIIPSQYVSRTRVLTLEWEAASESVKRSAADMMEQIEAHHLPEEALYALLAEAGIKMPEAPETIRAAIEEYRRRTGAAWEPPTPERLKALMEAGEKSTVIAEALKGAEKAQKEAGERCLDLIEGVLAGQEEKLTRPLTPAQLKKEPAKTVLSTYEAVKSAMNKEIQKIAEKAA